MQNRYTVIIPVYNALDSLKKCLESVLKNTPKEVHVIVIDDASSDAEVMRYLTELSIGRAQLELAAHRKNVGFVRTANDGIGIALSINTDPILLNSDTIVPPGWVERLDEARRSNPKCCSVSPLSNECCQYSVPNAASGELPKHLTVEEMDLIVQETSGYAFPVVPCNIGFCMLMTREAIAVVGTFDIKWGRGYGEETDWCVRARAAGFECVLADNLYVYHKHRASFGNQSKPDRIIVVRQESANENRKEFFEKVAQWGTDSKSPRDTNQDTFLELYPNFEQEMAQWQLKCVQAWHRVAIADRLRPRVPGKNKLRVLYVCHHWGEVGGLEVFTRRLVNELASEVEITVLYPKASRKDWGDQVDNMVIHQDQNGVMRIVMSPRLVESKVTLGLFPFDFSAPHVEHCFQEVVLALAPDVIHFHHLGGFGTFNLPKIASAFGKVVLSVHDDYYLCPSYITAGWSCGRDVAKNCEQCRACVSEESDVLVEGKYDWGDLLNEREYEVDSMFSKCDAVVYPSESIRRRYTDQGLGISRQSRVIPHGVPQLPVVRTYRAATKLRVAWVGGCLPEKGWAAFAEVCRQLATDERFEFSVLGEWHQNADRRGLDHVRWHGRYEPNELPQLLQSVDLSIPSVARKEAFGLVVSECLIAGCPILLPKVATMVERFGEGHPYYDWGSADSLRENVMVFAACCRLIGPGTERHTREFRTRTMKQCAADYLALYGELVRAGNYSNLLCKPMPTADDLREVMERLAKAHP